MTTHQTNRIPGMRLALFDLDNTLLEGDSDHAWSEFLIDIGEIDGNHYRARNDAFYAQYQAGTLDIDAYLRFVLSTIAHRPPEQLVSLHARFMQERILPIVRPKTADLLAKHAQDTRILITATNAFITAPIAQWFNIEHLIACNAERVNGVYTGEPLGTLSFREGKITRLHEWLTERSERLSDYTDVFFYSDSHNDIPLLSQVTHPVAVDPDATLTRVAAERGWPIISLRADA
jgi:HAD superfamily hydrolase (TIGR01490 family)